MIRHFLKCIATRPLIVPLTISTRLITIILKHPGFPPGWGGEMPAVAHSIAIGKGFASPYLAATGPTALVPPVYPYFLSVFFKVFGPHSVAAGVAALASNAVLSTLVLIPLFVFTERLFHRKAALFALWVWAALPLAGYTDALFIWNTSLYTLTLTTFLALTISIEPADFRNRWLLYGALASFLIVLEPISLTVVGLSFLWLVYQRITVRTLILISIVSVVLPSGWLLRNFMTFHQPVFIRSGFGLELSVGIRNNELLGESATSLPNRNPKELEKYEQMGELTYVQSRYNDAARWIKEHPVTYAVMVAQRALSFWAGYSLFYGRFDFKHLFFALPALGAFLSLFFLRGRAFPLILSILLFYPLVSYLTHTELRYRLPIEPLLVSLTVGTVFASRKHYRSSVIARMQREG